MTHYDKGSFFERQLKALFEAKGFFVVRAGRRARLDRASIWTKEQVRSRMQSMEECNLLGQAHGNRLPGVGENHGNASVFGVESAAQGMAVLSIARA